MVTEVLRAERHRALGDVHRLAIVDALAASDLTPSELSAATGLGSNLLAFHLGVLEDAGLVRRHRSEGDARRRYVMLRPEALVTLVPGSWPAPRRVLFVCTRNAVRSQLAAALWSRRNPGKAESAGSDPAAAVHPVTRQVAARHGLDLGAARPRGYAEVKNTIDLVVSVCDLAREGGLPFAAPAVHWSVRDPVEDDEADVERAFAEIAARITHAHAGGGV